MIQLDFMQYSEHKFLRVGVWWVCGSILMEDPADPWFSTRFYIHRNDSIQGRFPVHTNLIYPSKDGTR